MTALQELIKIWKSEMGSYIPNAPIYKAFIEEAESYLEKEREQIILAFTEGQHFFTDYQSSKLSESEQYYQETYEDSFNRINRIHE